MRMPAHTRTLIDTAAATLGKSRTEFMIESARLHAVEVMLDQRAFTLTAEQGDALAAMLSAPPRANAALRDLLDARTPWG